MFYTLSVKSTLIEIILNIGQAIGDFIRWIISFLPEDPYNLDEILTVPESVVRVLGFVNWLVPIGRCIQIILVWFAVIASIWFVRFLLKIAHII